jgi:methyl-accepting chemotaxis protein
MKLTVSKKLFSGFLAVLLILVAIVTISYVQISSVDATYNDLVTDKARKVIMIKDLIIEVNREQVSFKDYLLGDEAALTKFQESHKSCSPLKTNRG